MVKLVRWAITLLFGALFLACLSGPVAADPAPSDPLAPVGKLVTTATDGVASTLEKLKPTAKDAKGGFYVAAVGNFEPGRKYTLDEIQQINDKSLDRANQSSIPSSSPDGQVSAAVATPDGFTLYNPGSVGDYTYNSTEWAASLQHCVGSPPTCTVTDTWKHKLTEYVYGTTSRRWKLTMGARRTKGSTSTSFSYAYYCGVDINNAPDQQCAGGGADGSTSGAMNPGDYINKNFGSNSSNRVFPLVRITALYKTPKGTATASTPFRGWDVCNNNSGTIKLCSSAKY